MSHFGGVFSAVPPHRPGALRVDGSLLCAASELEMATDRIRTGRIGSDSDLFGSDRIGSPKSRTRNLL